MPARSFSGSNFLNGGFINEQKRKREREQKLSTRQLINTKAVSDYSLETYDGDDLVYFMIRPTNLSLLSDSSVGARVYALMNVLKGVTEIEMLCLNSRENFEENKSFLRKRGEEERNPVVRRLLERDQNFLDRIEKSLKEQGFSASRAGSEDIKRIMAVYYEQNVTSEKFEDFDGERWIIPDD